MGPRNEHIERADRFAANMPLGWVGRTWEDVAGFDAAGFESAVRRRAAATLATLLASPPARVGAARRRDCPAAVEPVMARWSFARAECDEAAEAWAERTGDASGATMPPEAVLAAAAARGRASGLAWDVCAAGGFGPALVTAAMRGHGRAFVPLAADVLHHVRLSYPAEPDRAAKGRMRAMAAAVLRAGVLGLPEDDVAAVADLLIGERGPGRPAP